MIRKIFRLKESEVKKVLLKGKPFFSYDFVLNKFKNNLNHNRFAIIIGGKSAKTSVLRNYYRRSFYNLCKNSIFSKSENNFYDYSLLVKKKKKLENTDFCREDFEKQIKFLLKSIK